MHATGSMAIAHRWSRITRTPAVKLGGSVFRHTKQHVSDMTDGSDAMMGHCRMLEMGARRGTYEMRGVRCGLTGSRLALAN